MSLDEMTEHRQRVREALIGLYRLALKEGIDKPFAGGVRNLLHSKLRGENTTLLINNLNREWRNEMRVLLPDNELLQIPEESGEELPKREAETAKAQVSEQKPGPNEHTASQLQQGRIDLAAGNERKRGRPSKS